MAAQDKADNRLLGKLKSEFQKLSDAVKTSIPKIARAIKLLFTNLIVSQYRLMQAQKSVIECREWLGKVKPDSDLYQRIKKRFSPRSPCSVT